MGVGVNIFKIKIHFCHPELACNLDDRKSKATKRNKDPLLDAINKILLDLVQDINTSEQNLNRINSENEKKRSFLVVRVLDIQTKLRELIALLNERRGEYT